MKRRCPYRELIPGEVFHTLTIPGPLEAVKLYPKGSNAILNTTSMVAAKFTNPDEIVEVIGTIKLNPYTD